MATRLTAYLTMNGNAREAIKFYEEAIGAQVLFQQSFGEMPSSPEYPIPEEAKDYVGHAMLKVGESELMISDTFPGQPVQTGDLVSITISNDDVEKSRQMFHNLQQGGQVKMPLEETFFSPAYGIVTDKFGVTIHIYTEGKHE